MRGRPIGAVFLGAAGTLALTVLVLNLSSGERKVDHRIAPLYAVGDADFVRCMGNLLGPPLVDGNSVVTLLNGDRIFPAMLDAIRGARRTIDFETYIYWSGTIGKHFADALSRAGARRRQGARPARLGRVVEDGRGT